MPCLRAFWRFASVFFSLVMVLFLLYRTNGIEEIVRVTTSHPRGDLAIACSDLFA
jgi:hypothetical protein